MARGHHNRNITCLFGTTWISHPDRHSDILADRLCLAPLIDHGRPISPHDSAPRRNLRRGGARAEQSPGPAGSDNRRPQNKGKGNAWNR